MCFLFAYIIILYSFYTFWYSIPLSPYKVFSFFTAHFLFLPELSVRSWLRINDHIKHVENMQEFDSFGVSWKKKRLTFCCRKYKEIIGNQSKKCDYNFIKKILIPWACFSFSPFLNKCHYLMFWFSIVFWISVSMCKLFMSIILWNLYAVFDKCWLRKWMPSCKFHHYCLVFCYHLLFK